MIFDSPEVAVYQPKNASRRTNAKQIQHLIIHLMKRWNRRKVGRAVNGNSPKNTRQRRSPVTKRFPEIQENACPRTINRSRNLRIRNHLSASGIPFMRFMDDTLNRELEPGV
jgi:hypothetical protein